MEKLLSVIVPVYNVENYLRECIESLQKQTYRNLEILLIDDGSTDSSGQICDEYAKDDKRIRVFHVENGGVSRARNIGLNAMQGKYMALVDSDDYVLADCFSDVIRVLEEHDLDFCGYGSFRKGEGGTGTGNVSLSLEEDHDKRLADCLAHEGAFAWGCVVRAALWEGIRYPEGRIFEDSVIAYQMWDKIQRAGGIDRAYYFYRKNPGGICSSSVFKPKARYDFILAGVDRLAYAEKKGMSVPEARASLIKAVLSFFTSWYGMGRKEKGLYEKGAEILRREEALPYDASFLNTKYKLFLWSFNHCPALHHIGGLLSVKAQDLKATLQRLFA